MTIPLFFDSNPSTAADRTKPLSDLIDNVHFDIAANLSASYGGTGEIITDISNASNDFYFGTSASSESTNPAFVGTAGDPAAYFDYDLDLVQMASVTSEMQTLAQMGQSFSFICTAQLPFVSNKFCYLFATGDFNKEGPGVVIQVALSSPGHEFRIYQLGDSPTVFNLLPSWVGSVDLSSNFAALLFTYDAGTDTFTCIINDGTPESDVFTPLSPTPSNNSSYARFGGNGTISRLKSGSRSKTKALTLDVVTESEWKNTILPQLRLRDNASYT